MKTTLDTNSTQKDTIATTSVKDFMLASGFVSVVKTVRVNSNGYPYITFINADNVAENIYFSKNAAATVAEGDIIAKGFFDKLTTVQAVNTEGEVRTKLSLMGEGNRASIEDLF